MSPLTIWLYLGCSLTLYMLIKEKIVTEMLSSFEELEEEEGIKRDTDDVKRMLIVTLILGIIFWPAWLWYLSLDNTKE